MPISLASPVSVPGAGALRAEPVSTPDSLPSPQTIWDQVHAQAGAVAAREPLLRTRLRKLVLERPALSDALAAVLAHQLACQDFPEAELHALMRSAFEADAAIQSQMVADLVAVTTRDPACPNHLHVLLNLKGFHALQMHRVSHTLWRDGRTELAFTLGNLGSRIFGVDIHPAARIGSGVMLDHGTGIVIGETSVVEDNVSILQSVTLGGTGKEHGDRHPKIRHGVLIGAGAKILGNIEIGAMSKVAAGSVVLKDVPAHCTVAGVPAKVVRLHHNASFPSFDMDQTI